MDRWEYKLISSRDAPGDGGLFKGRSRESIEAYLNGLGGEGWEVVSMDFWDDFASEKSFAALLKRRKG